MDMAVVFEWFGQIRAAAQAHEPRQREIWTRWAMLWGGARRSSLPSRGSRNDRRGCCCLPQRRRA